MLTKLLFTALILIGGFFLLRLRAGNRPRYAYPPAISAPRRPVIRRIAYGVIGLMALSTAGYAVHLWNARHRVVLVRVVNTNTGSVATYRAQMGDVDLAAGRFRTLEGQEVHPATVERLELALE